jgi:methionine synthase II (cobalamin-independent)
VHTCPGGDRDSPHSADVDYGDLLPSLLGLDAGYFLIQLASERDRERVCRIIGEHLRSDADGVQQIAHLGVTATLSPRPESPGEIRDQLVAAANSIPREQLGSTDDCGFSPFNNDEKPNHGSPDHARDVAFQKIRNRVEGTRMAADALGVS